MTEFENLNSDFDPITGKLRKKKDGSSPVFDKGEESKPVFKVEGDKKKEIVEPKILEPKTDKVSVLNNDKAEATNNSSGTPQPQKNSSQQPIKSNISPTNDYKDQFGNKLDGYNSYVDQGSLYSFSNTDNSAGYSDADFRKNVGNLNLSGKNIVGKTISKIADYFSKLNVHEVARNVVSDNFASAAADMGVNVRRGGEGGSWCADFTTFLLRKTMSIVDPNFSEKDYKKYPGSSGALVLRDQFKKFDAYTPAEVIAKNINNIDPKSLEGVFVFYKRPDKGTTDQYKEYKGHAQVCLKSYRDSRGEIMMVMAGGNEGDRIKTTTISLRDLISQSAALSTENTKSARFEGFGDFNKVIEKVNPTLSVYLQNKSNLKDQEYALDNKSTAKTRTKSNSHSIEG